MNIDDLLAFQPKNNGVLQGEYNIRLQRLDESPSSTIIKSEPFNPAFLYLLQNNNLYILRRFQIVATYKEDPLVGIFPTSDIIIKIAQHG